MWKAYKSHITKLFHAIHVCGETTGSQLAQSEEVCNLQLKDSCQSNKDFGDFFLKNGYECCNVLSLFYCNEITDNSAY